MRFRVEYERYDSKFLTLLSMCQGSPIVGLTIFFIVFNIPSFIALLCGAKGATGGILFGIFGILSIVSYILFLFYADLDKLDEKISKNKKTKNNSIASKGNTPSSDLAIDENFAREILVAYFTDMGEDVFEDMGEEYCKLFDDNRGLIAEKIRETIKDNENIYGSKFLTADTDTDLQSPKILSDIGKRSFAITVYYCLNLSSYYIGVSYEKIINCLISVLDKNQDYLMRDEINNMELRDAIIKLVNWELSNK